MINGEFNWSKIPDGERIVLNGTKIISGHHRFVAARIASEVTGRPLLGAAEAIIPSSGFASAEAEAVILARGAPVAQPWSQIGLQPGAKPPSIKYPALEPEIQALRDAMGKDLD